ncbi:substrate-binding periplasmic protein [Flocculibacter collagenilyticus]|uniref:substrate-binding periplasmic protein n=1 Tax=Flocculibacter collagenilyticus TaxID=2744479 RepID=UPI0018F29AD7|nr:transporter substrate-binding domain-containing protein [Flocculibacter collagenilyticus]
MNNGVRTLIPSLVIGFVLTCMVACNPQQSNNQQGNEVDTKVEQSNQAATAPKESSKATNKQNDCQLTVGFDTWEPYQYVDIDREVKGLDIEILRLAAEKMECDLAFHQATWVELLGELRSGEIDLVLGASKTAERENFAIFSSPYREESFSLYVRNADDFKYQQADIKEFVEAGHKVGLVDQYYYGDTVDGLMDDDKLSSLFVPAMMSEINIARLLDMDIDGVLEDSFVGASIIRRKGLGQYITKHQITINTGSVYVMFSKKSVKPEIVNEFNKALDEIRNSGKFEELTDRYSMKR